MANYTKDMIVEFGKRPDNMPDSELDSLQDEAIEIMKKIDPEIIALKKKLVGILQQREKQDWKTMSVLTTACINVVTQFFMIGLTPSKDEKVESLAEEMSQAIKISALAMHREHIKQLHKKDKAPSYIGGKSVYRKEFYVKQCNNKIILVSVEEDWVYAFDDWDDAFKFIKLASTTNMTLDECAY